MAAQDINAPYFETEVLKANIPVLVDFWAPWCGPCRMMAPILDQLSEDPELKSQLKIVKINTEERANQMLAYDYQIQSIPNMKLFFNGEVIEDFIGMRPKDHFKQELLEVITKLDIPTASEDEATTEESIQYQIEQFYDENLAHASYAILSKGKVALVDPGRDPEAYYKFAAENNAEIVAVFETHPHADFISSHRQIHAEKGANIFISRIAQVKYPHIGFDEGDEFNMGDVVFRSLNTPGHSPDSITISLETVDGEMIALFTGDTLFIGDVGRPDLREKAGAIQQQRQELAEQMYESVQKKLAKFTDEVLVYPAHGNGSLCGKNLSDERQSTIGAEKKVNPGFLINKKADFVKYLLTGQPFIPQYFGNSVEINRVGAGNFKEVLPNLLSRKSASILNLDDLVIDVRPKAEFDKNHLAGAINIQFDGKFETWLGAILAPETKFYLVTGKNSLIDVVKRIANIGYEQNILGVISEDEPFPNSTSNSTGEELTKTKLESEYVIVDVRTPDEVEANKYFDTSLHIPLHELAERITELDLSKPVVVHCEGGYRSQIGATIIRGHHRNPELVIDLSSQILDFKQAKHDE